MLAEIGNDRGVIVPGELVCNEDGKRQLAVYPLALVHFQTHRAETSAVYAAITKAIDDSAGSADPGDAVQLAAVGVAKVLMTTGLKLLSDCCIPPVDGPRDAMAAIAAGSWAAMSIDPQLFIQDQSRADDTGETPMPPLRFQTAIARLVAAGHSYHEIFVKIQTGVDGKPLPYPGWTLPQFFYFLRGDDTRRARLQADATQAVAMGISGCFGNDGGDESYREYIAELRAV